ncbi:Actin-related protein 2 [Camellia lanceoleosa]|uniref:Actin-related protein 2 n=1 Tax=Camellia lanceoleosa TaxID=1840588 RepID=A0ACC0F5B8_9ERIC|nr:Actin-related protein 2 [Camellia lanceoleosa]
METDKNSACQVFEDISERQPINPSNHQPNAVEKLIVPIVDGYSFAHLTKWINVAGRHITSYLVDLLQRRGYAMNSTADFEIVRDVKENLCYLREYQLGLETTILVKNYTELNKIDAYPQTKCEPKVLVEFYKKRFLAQQ